MMKVAIMILNWNGTDLLKNCLSSIMKTDYEDFKVIVVDNGSIDNSVEMVKSRFKDIDVFELKKNLGACKGRNMGIKYVAKKYNPNYFVLLDNDIEIIERDWLSKLIRVAESSNEVGIVGCKLLYPDGRVLHAGGKVGFGIGHIGYGEKDEQQYRNIYEVTYVQSACILVKKEVLKKIGLMDEVFNPYPVEDLEYCVRARRNNFKTLYCGDVSLIHKHSQSVKKFKRLMLYYYKVRNKFIFIMRYYPHLLLLFLFITAGGTLIEKMSHGFRIRSDFFLRWYIVGKALNKAFRNYKRSIIPQI
jgi:hypothetical protein